MKTLNRLILFIFFLQLFSNPSFGQSAVPDTVKNRLDRARQMSTYNKDAALQLMQNTLDFAVSKKDKESEWDALRAIGELYFKEHALDKALGFYQQTMNIAIELDNKNLKGLSLLDIGYAYMRLGRIDEAKSNFLKSYDIFKENDDKFNQANIKIGLGNVNTQLGLSEQALEDYMFAYNTFDELGLEDRKADMNINISYYHLMNGQGEAALPYVLQGLDYQLKEGNKDEIAMSYGNLGYTYSLMSDYPKAFENYQLCVAIAKENQFTRVEYDTYKDMAETYKQSGNYKKAVEYQTKYYTLKDSVIGKQTQDRVSELRVEFENIEQEREIKTLQEQQQSKNLQLVLLGISLGLLVMLGWMIIQRQRHNIKKKQDLLSKNDKIHRLEKELIEKELQQKILQQEKSKAEAKVLKQQEAEARHYAKALEASNKELEQFAHVVSHDLREPIRMVKSYMGLIKRAVDKETLERTGEFFHYAIDGAERMDKMVLGILNIAKVQQQELDLQPLSLNQTVETATQNLHEFIEEKNAKVIYKDLPTIQGDNLQIVQLVQNLINNGLKYNTSDTPTVWIEHKVIGNQIELSFKDNGIGIADEYQERVFQMFQRLENHQFSGTGIGLATCKKIVERHRGTIDLTSIYGEGTTFFVRLPLS